VRFVATATALLAVASSVLLVWRTTKSPPRLRWNQQVAVRAPPSDPSFSTANSTSTANSASDKAFRDRVSSVRIENRRNFTLTDSNNANNNNNSSNQKSFTHYLMHVPKTGGEYVAETLNRLLYRQRWYGEEYTATQRYMTCNVGTAPTHKFYAASASTASSSSGVVDNDMNNNDNDNRYFPFSWRQYRHPRTERRCAMWMSESPVYRRRPPPHPRENGGRGGRGAGKNDSATTGVVSAGVTPPPVVAVAVPKYAYTVLRDPRTHVASQYFHCAESDARRRKRNQLSLSLRNGGRGGGGEQGGGTNSTNTTTPTTAPTKGTTNATANAMVSYYNATLESWLREWVDHQRKFGNDDDDDDFDDDNTAKRRRRRQQEKRAEQWMRKKFNCYNPTNMQWKYVSASLPSSGHTKTTNTASDEVAVRRTFDVVGDQSQMDKSVCVIFAYYTGYLAPECNCTSSDNDGVDVDTTERTGFAHGVTHHGDTYEASRTELELIDELTRKDAALYQLGRKLFEENVRTVEAGFGVKLCDKLREGTQSSRDGDLHDSYEDDDDDIPSLSSEDNDDVMLDDDDDDSISGSSYDGDDAVSLGSSEYDGR